MQSFSKEFSFKKFHNEIDFDILYNNFGDLLNEYKDIEEIKSFYRTKKGRFPEKGVL